MDKIPFLETGFLITEEDFINMSLTRQKYSTPKENRLIMRILGFLAVLCGVAAYIVLRGNIYQIICWLLLITIGLFALFYYDVINPSMIRKQAKKFYNFNKNAITSKTVRFYDDSFQINSDNYKLSVPKKFIYTAVESKTTILIYLDKNEFCFIPKRVFSEEQLKQVQNFVHSKDPDKYHEIVM
ncbi:MAG: YcxB family protein [Acutalibacteraceae bacterium]